MKNRLFSALTVVMCLVAMLMGGCAQIPTQPTDPETVPESTGLPENIMQKSDPKEDNALNVFFVSNSTCYYFTDELYGLLTAAGYENVTLALNYYSGCPIKTHYEWWKAGLAGYQLRILDKDGLHVTENVSLKGALELYNWDVISFDNNARSFASGEVLTSLANAEPYFGMLYKDLKEQFPLTKYYWHEVWANEIGYSMAFNMETKEQRTKVYEAKKGVAQHMHNTYGVGIIPTGGAWEKVRDMELFTTPVPGLDIDKFTLCTRVQSGKLKDDYSHDGDMGGGQYLNACVWFEVITGKSCIGNTFRPSYQFNGIDCSLSEEKIAILQKAAHEAVAEFAAQPK